MNVWILKYGARLSSFIDVKRELSVLLALLMLANFSVYAEEKMPPLPSSEPEWHDGQMLDETSSDEIYRVINPEDNCDRSRDTYDYDTKWYDDTQSYFNGRLCTPAAWFDSFFGDDRIFDEGAPGTYVRWRNEFTFDEEEDFKFKMRLSLSAELPALSKKLRLTFENDTDDDLRDLVPGSSSDTQNSLGFQFDLKDNVRSKFSVSATFSPRIRFRYRYTYPIEGDIVLRATQEVQNKKGVSSALTRFDFEKLLFSRNLLRLTTEVRVSEEFDGVDWLQTVTLFQRLSSKSSLSYESSVNGITEPHTKATNYRVGIRYRRNIHRKWLFFEIAPEYTWPITLDEFREEIKIDRRSKWLLFFRLEVHFGNATKKQYEQYN